MCLETVCSSEFVVRSQNAGGEEKSYFFCQEGRAGLEGPAGCAHFAGWGRSPDFQGTVRRRRRVHLFSCVPRREKQFVVRGSQFVVQMAGGVGRRYFADDEADAGSNPARGEILGSSVAERLVFVWDLCLDEYRFCSRLFPGLRSSSEFVVS